MIQIHIARQQGTNPTAAADAINAYLVDWQEQHPKRRMVAVVSAQANAAMVAVPGDRNLYSASGTEITVIFSSEDVA